MITFLKHELLDIATRPLLWLGTFGFAVFLLHAVAHLNIEDDKIRIAIYQTLGDTDDTVKTFKPAQGLIEETAGISVISPDEIVTDIATQMFKDDVKIAITRTTDTWRFTLMSRSILEHRKLVRIAQLLGLSLSQNRPWYTIVENTASSARNWPKKIQISGITADPGSHARVFIPKIISLLAYFIAFAFACRSMIRDISSNTLPLILAASNGHWENIVLSKVLSATFMGILTFLALLVFASMSEGFQIKEGLYITATLLALAVLSSSFLGVALSLFARTESRIYFFGSGYLILLVLLSGLIAEIDPREKVLSFISNVFPVKYAMDSLADWMFFGVIPSLVGNPANVLFALLILSVTVTFVSVIHYRRAM